MTLRRRGNQRAGGVARAFDAIAVDRQTAGSDMAKGFASSLTDCPSR